MPAPDASLGVARQRRHGHLSSLREGARNWLCEQADLRLFPVGECCPSRRWPSPQLALGQAPGMRLCLVAGVALLRCSTGVCDLAAYLRREEAHLNLGVLVLRNAPGDDREDHVDDKEDYSHHDRGRSGCHGLYQPSPCRHWHLHVLSQLGSVACAGDRPLSLPITGRSSNNGLTPEKRGWRDDSRNVPPPGSASVSCMRPASERIDLESSRRHDQALCLSLARIQQRDLAVVYVYVCLLL